MHSIDKSIEWKQKAVNVDLFRLSHRNILWKQEIRLTPPEALPCELWMHLHWTQLTTHNLQFTITSCSSLASFCSGPPFFSSMAIPIINELLYMFDSLDSVNFYVNSLNFIQSEMMIYARVGFASHSVALFRFLSNAHNPRVWVASPTRYCFCFCLSSSLVCLLQPRRPPLSGV